MRKYLVFIGVLAFALTAQAAVTVDDTPDSLVISAETMAADDELAVFEFAMTGSNSETLDSVTVTVNSDDISSSDLDGVSVYRDDGDGLFDTGDDEAGSTSTVNIDSTTDVPVDQNNDLDGDKFFVVIETDSTWGGGDCMTVTLNTDGIETSSDSPQTNAVTTAAICATVQNDGDTTGPDLDSAVAVNKTGSTAGKEAGDKVVLTFDEATDKPVIDEDNIDDVLGLDNGHSWLAGDGQIGSATWNSAGTVLTIVLSGGVSLPTVAVGDEVTVDGSVIEDMNGDDAQGSEDITGSFSPSSSDDGCDEYPIPAAASDDSDEDSDSDESDEDGDECDEDGFGRTCVGGIINGRLYRAAGQQTVYLAAGCRLKPFRGAAVFHARGHKFQNIIELVSLDIALISQKPALPAGGTLVKGTDKTVWFVTEDGKRKGFNSEKAFRRLGFSFGSVKQISDSDLAELGEDLGIDEDDGHPEGAVLKCTVSSTVYMIEKGKKLAFTNAAPYLERGHTWDAIANIDCNLFNYQEGAPIAS